MSNEYNRAIDSQYRSIMTRCDMLDANITACDSLWHEENDTYVKQAMDRKRLEYYTQLMSEFGSIYLNFNSLMTFVRYDANSLHRQDIIDVMFNRFNSKMEALLDRLRIFTTDDEG